MAEFTYKAINKKGQTINGNVSSSSREAAVADLRSQGNQLLSIKEAKARGQRSFGKSKVKLKDMVIFTRELSTMISAGVPLPRALGTLEDQMEDKYFKSVIGSINHDIESGAPLADAMAKFPATFNDIYGKIFKDLGGPNAQLPVYTRDLLAISSFLTGHSVMHAIPLINKIPIIGSLPNMVFIIGLSFVGLNYFRRYIHTEKGRYRWHGLLLRLPVIGNIITKVAIARFSRTFSSLMSSGVSVLDALEVTGKAVGNKVIQNELIKVAQEVKNGQPLGKQLLQAKYFPPIVGQMMTVGEETGKIDQVLIKVADFYEEEVDVVIDSLASIIEPAMIVVLGTIVGIIAASVMGPIASLSKNVGG
jgi:type IV pilus assembly protein PilC